MQEPFRWLVDLTVIQAFESKTLDLSDFYFTGDDYRYKFEPEGKQRLIDRLRERFNSGVDYKGHMMKWDTVIQEKTSELARYLHGRSRGLDFSGPSPILKRSDDRNIRQTIINLTQARADKLGIRKSTLRYLQERAHHSQAFRTYSKTLHKLETEEIGK